MSLVASVGFSSTALAQSLANKADHADRAVPSRRYHRRAGALPRRAAGEGPRQPVIVEQAGAGATIGADFVARRSRMVTPCWSARCITPSPPAFTRSRLRLSESFAPATTIALVPNVLTVSAANPAKSVAELIGARRRKKADLWLERQRHRAAPDRLQFENLSGVGLVHVPYKGSGPLTTGPAGRTKSRCRSTP